VPLAGKPMVEWSVAAFRACESVRSIVVAAPPGHANDLGADGLEVVDGGATRAESVANALAVTGTELIAIHDAARPLLTPELVEELVTRLAADPEAAGVIAAAPITDTVKLLAGNALIVGETLDRSRLWAAQTPQVFRADALREALAVDAAIRGAATDESMLVEERGGRVLIHPTSAENLKVTTPLDLRVAELLLAERAGSSP
jgi:2-C-methyl-D-erythritol 4-phosphate cytidylyltransferase